MRVLVTGATSNVGTSVVPALVADDRITEIVALARRLPDLPLDKVRWVAADIAADDLTQHMAGVDSVVHLAWAMQPSRDEAEQWRTNITGTRRVLDAAAAAGVASVVAASSVGAYSPGPKDDPVDESWPTEGVPTSSYSRQKAYNERIFDAFEAGNPAIRLVRLRPGLIFKSANAHRARQLFIGPFIPPLVLRQLLRVLPASPDLVVQVVAADDVAQAFRLAVVGDASGAFNLAADPVLDPPTYTRALGAVGLPLSTTLLKAAANLTWHLRLHPADPGWIDLAASAPVMDTSRAREVLGWEPGVRADDVLADFVDGLGREESFPTPPMTRATSGALRVRELLSGVGARER